MKVGWSLRRSGEDWVQCGIAGGQIPPARRALNNGGNIGYLSKYMVELQIGGTYELVQGGQK